MAKKKGNSAYAGLGGIRGSSKEVNPTFSLSTAPSATPASKRQVNPTVNATKKATSTAKPPRTRVNPTFAVANSSKETSKGTTGRKFVAMKNKVGSALATKSNPTPLKATYKSKTNAVGAKIFATPQRNIQGSVGKGRAVPAKADKTHNFSSPKDFSIPTSNTSAPYGPNATEKAPMTVKRLKKLGY